MSPSEALELVRLYAGRRAVVLTRHARQRAQQRGASEADVIHALEQAQECRTAEDERWRITGPDLDGDELTAIAALEDRAVVVTLF